MGPYDKPFSPQEYLMHYGVKGMKWGVRRYQNYDGSYTRKGLERYRKAESDYETAKSKADETRAAYKSGQATRQQVKDADKLADEGKKLYQSGKTISGNTQATYLAEGVIIAGSTVVSRLLANQLNNQEVANIAASTIAIGGTIVNGLLAAKTSRENKRLRAYYAH